MHVVAVRTRWDVQGELPSEMCAIRCVDEYVDALLAYGWDMESGYVFDAGRLDEASQTWVRSGVPMSAVNASKRFSTKLEQVGGRLEGQTLHGNRVRNSVERLLSGCSVREVMAQCLWRSPAMAEHYMKIYKVFAVQHHTGVRQVKTDLAESPFSYAQYERMNVDMCDEQLSSVVRAWGRGPVRV